VQVQWKSSPLRRKRCAISALWTVPLREPEFDGVSVTAPLACSARASFSREVERQHAMEERLFSEIEANQAFRGKY
jgi:hypothetical protein